MRTRPALHQLDHILLGLAVFEAGRSVTKKRQRALLAFAALLFIRTHVYHHRSQ